MSRMLHERAISQLNALSANPTKWSNTLKQFVGNLPTNCFSVFDYFVKLVLKGLIQLSEIHWTGRINLFTHFGPMFPNVLIPHEK